MKSISIYISYHKPSRMFENKYLVPIQVGTELTGKRFCQIHDNDGCDNISAKNSTYCELTAQYWAWKNSQADYIGFLHYRRHLVFRNSELLLQENVYGLIDCEVIDEKYIQLAGLGEACIRNIVERNDIVLPKAWDVRKVKSKSMYDHYKNASPYLHIEDYDKTLSIMLKKYPEYQKAAETYNSGYMGYFTNMFVMKKEIFHDYSAWLFSILDEVEKSSDITNYDQQEARIFGYLSEWLFGIYVTHHKMLNTFKFEELQRTFVHQVDDGQEVQPAFSKDNIAICTAYDQKFATQGGVMLQSIIEQASDSYNYDIFVLNEDLSERDKTLAQTLISGKKNISIRFLDVKSIFMKMNLPLHMHFTRASYYRLKIATILSNYDKVLYIDADTIMRRDVADLFHFDICDNYVAAMADYVMSCFRKLRIGSLREAGGMPANDYLLSYVGMKNPNNYFQAGVMLFNTRKIRQDNMEQELISYVEKKRYWFPDQDIMNKVFEGKVKYFDLRWNVMNGNGDKTGFYSRLPASLLKAYQDSKRDPYIIHYAGENKPGKNLEVDFAEDFWRVARNTPWYEKLILELPRPTIQHAPIQNNRPSFSQKWKNSYRKRKRNILRIIFRPQQGQYRLVIFGQRLINRGLKSI